jgi:threonine dehydratase
MDIDGAGLEAGVRKAHRLIAPDIRRTPVEFSEPLSRETGARVLIKWECGQITGSFKLRGALHKLRSLSRQERRRGVVSASTGNHGLAISYAARAEGVALELFLPATVSDVKRKKLEDMGVGIGIQGSSCEITEAFARETAARTGRVFVSPYNDLEIVRGAGTVGLEAAEDAGEFDDMIVPVGGGGLVAGIAGFLKTFRPGVIVTGVEPEASGFMAASVRSGRLVEIDERPTVADAVAGGIEPGSVTFPLCRDLVDAFLTVPEAVIVRAMDLVFEHHHRMIEGAGALSLAALLHFAGRWRGRTVMAVVSGGNVDPERFKEIVTGGQGPGGL